ncbi:MAG: type IX secretion system protein PorD, partial [Bacteroidia bacterium]
MSYKLKVMRYKWVLFVFITYNSSLITYNLSAQELNCQVTITTQLSGADNVRIFGTSMQTQVNDFLNNYRFTLDKFEQIERIDCEISINVTTDNGGGSYQGTIQIIARRPVFKAGYNTPIFNYIDKNFSFNYVEGQPMIFNLQGFDSDLTSVLSYYAYIILAMDYDSFSLLGGTDLWKKAQIILNNAQNNGVGWASNDSPQLRNRYTYIDNIMSPMFQPLRESVYTYHRKGMDIMYDKVEDGRAAIIQALDNIREVHKNRPGSFNVQSFFEAKNQEIVQIFKKATAEEKT